MKLLKLLVSCLVIIGLVGGTVLAAGCAQSAPAQAQSASQMGVIVAIPSTVVTPSSITITGANFTPGENITLNYVFYEGVEILVTKDIKVSSTGTFLFATPVPEGFSGVLPIKAYDLKGNLVGVSLVYVTKPKA